MCLARLGDYKGTIHWGKIACGRGPDFTSDFMPHYRFHSAIAYGMLGQDEGARKLLSTLASAGDSPIAKARLAQNILLLYGNMNPF